MGEKKTGQAPKQALAAGWSADELLRMLADPRYLPPPLGLKCDKPAGEDIPGTHKIEVRRVFRRDDQIAYIQKRYLGRYAHRAQYELALLDVVQKIPVVRDHVVGAAGQFHGQNNHGLVLTMRWGGLSVEDWNVLLGEQSPFKTSCVAVLSLVRAVLRASSQFHSMGFVHGDLLLRNVVLPQMASDKPGRHRLDMSKTRLIDLEFSLAPLTAIKSGSTQSLIPREWFKETQGATIWLHPEYHSAQMNPGLFVSQGWRSTNGQRERDWQIPADWYPDADTRLQRVDWGADFFSIAAWIELLTSAGNFDDDEAEHDAMQYLLTLPERLRTFDRPIDPTQGEAVPRTPPPHGKLILEIDHLIGSHEPDDALSYRLPSPSAAAARPPALPTNYSTWETGAPAIDYAEQAARHAKDAITKARQSNHAEQAKLKPEDRPTIADKPAYPLNPQNSNWSPALVTITSLKLQVAIDPVTEHGFTFNNSPSAASRPQVKVTRKQIENYLKELNHRWGLPVASLDQTAELSFRQHYSGFRLLDIEEWIGVCKAGFDTSYAYAIGPRALKDGDLMAEHAVYQWSSNLLGTRQKKESEDPLMPQPVDHDSNIHNSYGVRGMHGNVWELVTKASANGLYACGGSFLSLPQQLQWDVWEERTSPNEQRGDTGFRVCRTIL